MDYEINITSLNSKLSDLEKLKNDVDNIYNIFNSSYINTMNSSELSSIKSNISQSITRLKNSYVNSINWLNNYINDLNTLEDSLANFNATNINEILEFKGEFVNIFSKVTIPALRVKGKISTNEEVNAQYNIGHGGVFVPDNSKGVYGSIVSSLDGKRHVVFRQSQIAGWGQNCNRAAAASIASAFTYNPWDAVNAANNISNGIGYKSQATDKYFSQFGLSATVKNVGGSYDSIKNNLISTLSRGSYAMFDLSEPNVKGQSGQEWTSTRHWLSVLDIKKTGNGPNDYAIFVSDSGHKGSTVDHGLGTGWYNINEFSGQRIQNYTTVTRTIRT